jgi:hypothetical protein
VVIRDIIFYTSRIVGYGDFVFQPGPGSNRPCGIFFGNAGKGDQYHFLLTGMPYGVSGSLDSERGCPTHLTTAADAALDHIGRIPRYARIDITHSKAEQ